MSGWKSILAMFATALILASGGKAFDQEMRVIDYNQRIVRETDFQKGVYGDCLIVFNLFHIDPLHELQPISVFALDSASCHSADTALSHILWESPGLQRYRIETKGHSPITIDSVRSVPDSMLFVRIEVSDEKCDSCDSSIQSIAVSQHTRPLFEPVPDRRISGVVTDCSLGRPISGAQVYFEEAGTRLTTDSFGRFFLSPDTLTRATLDIWHPLYDSIRFIARYSEKEATKELQIYFESQRRSPLGRRLGNSKDSVINLLVYRDMLDQLHQECLKISTYEVAPGSFFGSIRCNDGLRGPLRFLGMLPDGSAWIKFSQWIFVSADDAIGSGNSVLIGFHPSVLRCLYPMSDAKTWEIEIVHTYSPSLSIYQNGFHQQRRQ